MPYLLPTATQLKTRFPEFADVADATVDAVIADASRFVDESWFELDYQPAIIALAAHFLTTEGALGGRTDVSGAITSEKLGDASWTYATPTGSASSEFSGTAYGRTFIRIQRVNVPGVVLL